MAACGSGGSAYIAFDINKVIHVGFCSFPADPDAFGWSGGRLVRKLIPWAAIHRVIVPCACNPPQCVVPDDPMIRVTTLIAHTAISGCCFREAVNDAIGLPTQFKLPGFIRLRHGACSLAVEISVVRLIRVSRAFDDHGADRIPSPERADDALIPGGQIIGVL